MAGVDNVTCMSRILTRSPYRPVWYVPEQDMVYTILDTLG